MAKSIDTKLKFSSVEKILVLNYIFGEEGVPNVLTIVWILISQILKNEYKTNFSVQNNYLNSYIFVGNV